MKIISRLIHNALNEQWDYGSIQSSMRSIYHIGLNKTNCCFLYCCVACQMLMPDHTAMRPEWDWANLSEWKPGEKMKSFHHRLISASSRSTFWNKRSIYSETYLDSIHMLSRFPVYTDSMLESSHASTSGKWVRRERLNNVIINLVRWGRRQTENPTRKCLQVFIREWTAGLRMYCNIPHFLQN